MRKDSGLCLGIVIAPGPAFLAPKSRSRSWSGGLGWGLRIRAGIEGTRCNKLFA